MRPVRRAKDVPPFKYKNPTIAADRRVVTKLLYRFHKYVPMSERALNTFVLTWAEIAFLRSSAKESPLLNVSGRRIKRLRMQMESGWTQSRLARALQSEGMTVDLSGVAQIEGGYRKISDVVIVIIAKALGVTPTDATDKLVHEVLQDSYRPPQPPHTSPT